MALSTEFEQAAIDSRKLTEKPGPQELLQIYALFKIAHKEDINAAPKPGFLDIAGKAKRNKWQELLDAGETPETAEKKYVEEVEKLKEKYKFDANKEPESVGK